MFKTKINACTVVILPCQITNNQLNIVNYEAHTLILVKKIHVILHPHVHVRLLHRTCEDAINILSNNSLIDYSSLIQYLLSYLDKIRDGSDRPI